MVDARRVVIGKTQRLGGLCGGSRAAKQQMGQAKLPTSSTRWGFKHGRERLETGNRGDATVGARARAAARIRQGSS